MTSRRTFFKMAAISGASLYIPETLKATPYFSNRKIKLSKNEIILFQGDSITDAGRNKEDLNPNTPKALGSGYSMLASASLLNKHADENLTVYNRGVSGNKVFQLRERWQKDCLDLKPTILSIHIGVNDYWHTLSHDYPGTVEVYEQDYRSLLKQTREILPHIKLILCEPFGVKGVKAVTDEWFPAFDGYRTVVRKLAIEFDAAFIPFHDIFLKAQKKAPGKYWTSDGVHPTLAGTSLMAQGWLNVFA